MKIYLQGSDSIRVFQNRFFKRISFIFLLTMFCLPQVFAQVTLEATSGTTAGSYTTFKAALDAINNGTHRGRIRIRIHSNTTENTAASLDSSGNAAGSSYTSVLITPADTATVIKTITFDSPISVSLTLMGADSVTIDGRPSGSGSSSLLQISNTSTTANSNTIRMQSGVQNSVIRYTHLTAVLNPPFNTLFNLVIIANDNRNITIENNVLTGAAQSIQITGTNASPANNISISKNTIRNFRTSGIILNGGILNINIDSNFIVHEDTYQSNETTVLYGIDLQFSPLAHNFVYNITRNTIANLAIANPTSSSGVQGLRVFPNTASTNSTLNIINNSISLTRANNGINGNQVIQGFRYTGSNAITTFNLINNTVRLGGHAIGGMAGTINSIGFIKANTAAGATNNFFNNLIINERTSNNGQLTVGFWMNSMGGTNNIDYNNYHAAAGNYPAVWNGFTYNDAPAYRAAATPREQHTTMGNVNFTGANDLSIAAASQGDFNLLLGTPSVLALKDLTGTTRSALYPYKGAYEGQPFKQQDAAVSAVYTFGSLPLTGANPHIIKAAVTNIGMDTMIGLKVYADISAPNAHTDSVTIDTLFAGQTKTVSFAPYLYTSTGSGTVTVRLPDDETNTNNSKSVTQLVSNYDYGYTHPGLSADGGAIPADKYAVLFPYSGNAVLGKVLVPTNNSGYAYQVEIRNVVNDTPGTALWTSLQQSSLYYDTVDVPLINVSDSFFVVIKQLGSALGLSYINESPLRSRTFFSQTGTGLWQRLESTTTTHFMIDVKFAAPQVAINMQPQNDTLCAGSPVSFHIEAINATAYQWQQYTTSWNNITNTGVYAGSNTDSLQISDISGLNNTRYRCIAYGAEDSLISDPAVLFVHTPVTNNDITSSSQSICNGSAPAIITASAPTGGDGLSYQFKWISSNDSTNFVHAGGNDSISDYTSSPLIQNTWFKRVATSGFCSADTSAPVKITVNTPGTWTGTTSSAWNNTTNWSCPALPTSATNVTINAGAPNMPVITDAQLANNITIATGASLTLSNSASQLTISGALSLDGTLSNTNGKITFNGTATQTIPAATYYNLTVNNNAGVSLGGNVTVNHTLTFTNGMITLDNYNLLLSGAASAFTGVTSLKYIRTNGSGTFGIDNVGTGGKTGLVIFPIGTNTYSPVAMSNSGVADVFTARIIDSVTNTFSGTTPTGTKLTSGAVNKTWIVEEGTAGGSNVTISFQWSTSEELSGFTRGSSYVALYNGSTWLNDAAGAAGGANPWSRLRTGVTSFGPFGVGSGSALPVKLISFDGEKAGASVHLNWKTASEINNDRFEVERSANGITFDRIASVKGQGNTNLVTAYQHIDLTAQSFAKTNAASGIFYRLKQADLDGTVTYSNTIKVTMHTATGIATSVQPNPFNSELKVSIAAAEGMEATITIVDMTGRTVSSQNIVCTADHVVPVKDADALNAGVYFLFIKAGNGTFTHKIIKQ